MSDTPTPSEVLDAIEARYRIRFAGHARVSRSTDELDAMLSELATLSEAVGEDPEIQSRIDTDRDLYEREREAVTAARAVPGALSAFRLRLWADLAIGRYRRNFAGRDRSGRDVNLLDEVRTFLKRMQGEMQAMDTNAPHLELGDATRHVSGTLQMAIDEAARIRVARTGGAHAIQGTRYAQLANHQFHVYERGFAGQSRISRHPERLERIIGALEEISAGMTRLQRAGFDDTNNDRNLGLVVQRLKAFRTELDTIRTTRGEATVEQRIDALGAAANEVFGQYRDNFAGHDRATRDEELLDDLIEQLWAVALQMDALDRDEGHETNERNLGLVMDNLLMYQREWDRIREAKTDA